MKQPRPGNKSPNLRTRLFWPILLLLIGLPFLSWQIALHSSTDSTPARAGKAGPWGTLEYVDIDIELPEHFIDVEQTDPPLWLFKGYSREQVADLLRTSGLTQEQATAFLERTEWEETVDGPLLKPDDELVWSLSAQARSKIYSVLAGFPENLNQFCAFSYRTARLPIRMRNSGLSDSTIGMFKQLLYPQGSLVRFADVDLVLRKISDKSERVRFVKMLTRRSTMLVKLKVIPDANIEQLAAYWGMGGRAKDLRPLLDSLAKVPGGCKIDIAHLLPPIPRQRIYTFPYPDTNRTELEDCHWTALNFFEDRPAYFSGPEEIAAAIIAKSDSIGTDPSRAQFGDFVFIKTSDDVLVHSAVYIADGIVYTKNGAGLNQPWLYMKLEDMLAYYEMPNETVRIEFHRRKRI